MRSHAPMRFSFGGIAESSASASLTKDSRDVLCQCDLSISHRKECRYTRVCTNEKGSLERRVGHTRTHLWLSFVAVLALVSFKKSRVGDSSSRARSSYARRGEFNYKGKKISPNSTLHSLPPYVRRGVTAHKNAGKREELR